MRKACDIISYNESHKDAHNTFQWFWEIFEDMSKKDRELLLKFMSGDSRLKPNDHYGISIGSYDSDFPKGHTCSCSLSIPYF